MKSERIFWIAAIVILFIFLRTCGNSIFKPKPTAITKTDTITKYIVSVTDTQYLPEIVGVTNTIHVPKYIHDTTTFVEVVIEPTDTAAILQRYFQVVNYSDVQKIGDYGTVTINDSVTENRIKSRHLITNLVIPEKTITITKEVKRTIGYVGFSGMGSAADPFYSVGADLSLKFKSDKIFGVGVQYDKNGVLYYQGRFALPIRLKKR